jgi:methylated-DNA-protein-cysteine methyltransferase-like protein
MHMSFAERAYAVIRAIPYGRAVSYGGVAAILGAPRAARAVGRALFELPEGSDVPWWRVVNRNGEISIKGTLHGPALQRALLRSEGVKFDRRGRIDWRKFGWDGQGVPAGVRLDDATTDEREWNQERRSERKAGSRAQPGARLR